jgi:hypothetical protein
MGTGAPEIAAKSALIRAKSWKICFHLNFTRWMVVNVESLNLGSFNDTTGDHGSSSMKPLAQQASTSFLPRTGEALPLRSGSGGLAMRSPR